MTMKTETIHDSEEYFYSLCVHIYKEHKEETSKGRYTRKITNERDTRKCLRCLKLFRSTGKGNRVCGPCSYRN